MISSRLLHSCHRLKRGVFGGVAGTCLMLGSLVPAPALAVDVAGAKAEAAPEATNGRGGATQPMPPRAVEVVVVWGFRLRSNIHDTRVITLNQGYSELVSRDVCLTSICGFVMVREGGKWRASNVMAGTEAQLIEMQRNMERPETTIVIVHPTGSRRTVPEF